jgi:uncharacterized protein YbaP (TraB family)
MHLKEITRAYYLAIKWKLLRSAICILGLSLILFGSAGAHALEGQSTISSKHCLWVAESSSSKIFLLGSLHVLRSDAYPLANVINKAYGLSQKIVFETDLGAMLDPAAQARMMSLGLYPEGENLFQKIPPDLQSSLKKKLTGMGLPMDHFTRFRPWFLAVTLTTLELQNLGFSPAYGIDVHFYGRAKADKKEIGYLESVEYQLELLGKMNARDQNSFLRQTLRDLELAAEMADDMVTFWKKGDVNNLHHLLFQSFEGYPEIKDRLLYRRNKDWVRKIESMMEENKNVFVIVGAGHLIGPGSVVQILKQKGYRVVQR